MGNSLSQEMKESVNRVEQIIGYKFKNKRLLEEALTHSTPPSSGANSVTYHRLEFLGDAVISLAISKYFFDTYPQLKPSQLHDLRKLNVNNDNLARVAVRHGLYQYVRRFNVDFLESQVRDFAEAVCRGRSTPNIPAPKILADIVESIAAAVYYDVNFDLQKLWEILKGLLEPIITNGIEGVA